MRKLVFRLWVVLLPFFGLFGQGVLAYEMNIAIGHPEKENSYGWTPYVVLKNEVETRSNGNLKVSLRPMMMGKPSTDRVEMVRSGLIDVMDFADGHLATIYPPIQVISIPYLFAHRDIAWEVLDGPFGQRLIDDMAKKTGLRPLYWIENGGFRHYSNNKRIIRSPEDMKGLRIRTMSTPLHMKIVSDLGARAVPITWGEVYHAIESGLVDGQENSITAFMIPQLEEIQPNIVLDGHVYGAFTLLMNDTWYQSLPQELKEVINQSKRLSAIVNRGLSISGELAGIDYLRNRGVNVYAPTKEQIEMFRQKTQATAIEWLKANVGENWVREVLEATKAAEKKLGYRK